VQGVLAPVQFLVFLVSLALVLRYLATGEGYLRRPRARDVGGGEDAALYTIMVTGCIWEKVVFGAGCSRRPSTGKTCSACWCWPCTPPTWWRWPPAALDARGLMWLALAAYAAYVINAGAVPAEAARRAPRAAPRRHSSRRAARA
jgi:3-vinyl bacteriochlorophyllide hydratase